MKPTQVPTAITGRLLLDRELCAASPPCVSQDTPLGALRLDAVSGPLIIATGDAGSIVGFVSAKEVCERLSTANDRERARWEEMPIAYLIRAALPAAESASPKAPERQLPCSVVLEGGEIVAVTTRDDVLVSWRRLAGTVAGATTDPLTGLLNRVAYDRRLIEEWDRAQRSDFSVGIIIVDLDHFKEVNDQYGHDAGDEVLKQVSSTLRGSLRSYDILARFGGDEFVALCIGCRPDEIRIPLSRVLTSLLASAATRRGRELRVSASVGAAVRHDGFAQASPAELFSAADQCLYQAKASRGTACWTEFDSRRPRQVSTVESPVLVAEGFVSQSLHLV